MLETGQMRRDEQLIKCFVGDGGNKFTKTHFLVLDDCPMGSISDVKTYAEGFMPGVYMMGGAYEERPVSLNESQPCENQHLPGVLSSCKSKSRMSVLVC